SKKWVFVYGRRKTGKTFLVERLVTCDEYFFVKRDRSILSREGGKEMLYTTFIELLKRALSDGKTVAVDEFHRLGESFFDFVHYTEKKGKLILISSTLFLSKELLSSKSPLLGLFKEVPVGLITLQDGLRALDGRGIANKQLLELAILLREPIAVDYVDEKKDPRDILADIVLGSVRTIPALIGEIFTEEERRTSAVYEGILRALAAGKVVSGEIASQLFSRKLIPKDDPSIIQQYLTNLVAFGIIKKLPVFGKKRFVYKHVSPLFRIFYYADEKYNVSERPVGRQEIRSIIDELLPRIVEDQVREALAKKWGLVESVCESGDFDIDACLLKFKKPEIAVEIKWGTVSVKDVRTAEQTLEGFTAKKRVLFVPDKKSVRSTLQVIDVHDLF
ncbi:MAG: ATP-binding protein, partial [Candidatus Aenigmarchaeota archaeon]|nr:ATP-binding protein [Candidatus Aenigmarchaeota archaeon]